MLTVTFMDCGDQTMKINKKFASVILIALPIILGFIVYLLTSSQMKDFSLINKPSLTPPPIVFIIAWNVLYVLLGVSSAIIYNAENSINRKVSLGLYLANLFFNMSWPIIFFGYGNYFYSIIWLVMLIGITVLMLIYYYKVSKVAFYLNIPYMIWLPFALYLNIGVFLLNH